MTEREAVQTIWGYMLLHHALRLVDALVVLGSREPRVAEWAAELYKRHLAERVVITGGQSPQAIASYGMGEARKFAEILQEQGVPSDSIWLEEQATNTGENAKLAGELMAAKGLHPHSVLVVTKPYMERRAYATFKKWWPEWNILVSSPPATIDDWIAGSEWTTHETIDLMVGDLWRIKEFPARGFQIEQAIPREVWAAYEFLTSRGYGRSVRPGPETRPA